MSSYSTHATDIVAYTFDADIYAPDCIGEMFDRRAGETVEDALNRAAAGRGIDRSNERSYDSSVFPKVVFASDITDDESCGRCHLLLSEH